MQLEWMNDDAKVVLALSDSSLRVFDTASACQLHSLVGHTKDLYEVACHPFIPDLVASWAHDGLIILWDAASGTRIRRAPACASLPRSLLVPARISCPGLPCALLLLA